MEEPPNIPRSSSGAQSHPSAEKPDMVNRIIAFGVFALVSVVYLMTVAPTFSFWDCGEFVACSYTLGIAHPPGSPLYLLFGRLFSILPVADPSYGVNLLSVFTSAGAALFGYLIVQRLIARWPGAGFVSYVGGVVGATLLAFGRTAWSNAVETEVYGLTMLMLTAVFWLIIMAFDTTSTSRKFKYLLLAAYIMALGAGVHMTVFLAAPVALAVFAVRFGANSKLWYLFAVFMALELFLIFALSSEPNEIPFYVPLAITALVMLFHVFSLERIPLPLLITGGITLVALWPMYVVIWRLTAPDSSPVSSGESIGVVGLVALAGWGLYQAGLTVKHWLSRREFLTGGVGASAVYALGALALIGVTKIEPSYELFVAISGFLGAALVYVLRRKLNVLLGAGALGVALAIMGFWQFTFGVLGALALVSAEDWLRERGVTVRTRLVYGVVAIFAIALALHYSQLHTKQPGVLTIILGSLAIIGLLARFKKGATEWRLAVATLVLAGVAFSVNTYVPVRSSVNPEIDQNNPSRSLRAFVGYFERKQYGSQSMVDRMFKRRAEWTNSFGMHRRMGFAGFFREQYGLTGEFFAIIAVLGALGVWELFRRSPGKGAVFLTVLLLGTVGLVLYMNFADGTRMVGGRDYLEVRDRDYFFTPGFMFFGLAIGLGVAAVLQIIRETFKSNPTMANAIATSLAAVSLALPSIAIARNYAVSDRSGNYIPYDYAKNLLDSADPDAILITGGDNDTFPLWALQQVYRHRRDVAVMILSLSNTDWYLKQMRDKFGVPLELSDEQIEALRPYRTPEGRVSRIQDQIVDYLVLTQSRHKRPINFAVSVSQGQRRLRGESMENRFTLVGRVLRVRQDTSGFRIDLPVTDSLYTKAFSYRSLGADGVYQDPVSRGMTNAYASGFGLLSEDYRRERDYESALRVIRKGYEVLPHLEQVVDQYVRLLAAAGHVDEIYPVLERVPRDQMLNLVKRWAQRARGDGRVGEAIDALAWAHNIEPDDRELFYGLVALELEQKRFADLEAHLESWLTRHQDDNNAQGLLNQVRNQAIDSR